MLSSTAKGVSVPGPMHMKSAMAGAWLERPIAGRFAFQPSIELVRNGVKTLDAGKGGL